MAGGLGMFEEDQGKADSWTAPQSNQRPKPKKLTGPWGDYGGPAAGPTAQKAGKKRPGSGLLLPEVPEHNCIAAMARYSVSFALY